MVCSQSHEGNSMVILWLELLFFLSNIFIILGSLVGAWFDETNVKEPKAADLILIKDYRNSPTRKDPGIHIFTLQGYEMLHWGDRLSLPGVDPEAVKSWNIGDLKPVEMIESSNKIAIEDEAAEDDVEEEGGDDDEIQVYGDETALNAETDDNF